MIHFLIDYENVNYKGLEGIEYLEPTDSISIFYSDCCQLMEQKNIDIIWEKGCEIELVKLVSKRKNGLDFYIASKVGELFSSNGEINIAIVSNDKGFKAVRDYWNNRLNPTSRLVINDTIASCIVSSAEPQTRKTPIQNAYRKLDIEQVYDTWMELKKINESMHEKFDGTEFEVIIPDIVDVVKRSKEKKGLYLNSLKTFGRKSGLAVYRRIKDNGFIRLVS